MKRGEEYPYKIVKYNFSAGDWGKTKVAVVMGESAAERVVNHYNAERTREEIDAGWRYGAERTTERPPTKPKHPAASRERLGRRGSGR